MENEQLQVDEKKKTKHSFSFLEKISTNKKIRNIIFCSLFGLSLVFDFIVLLTHPKVDGEALDYSFLAGAFKYKGLVSITFITLLFIALALSTAIAITFLFLQKDNEKHRFNDLFILLTLNTTIILFQILIGAHYKLLSGLSLFLLILSLIILAISYTYLLIVNYYATKDLKKETKINNSSRLLNLIIATISIVFMLVMFFMPLYTTTNDSGDLIYVTLVDGISYASNLKAKNNIILFSELCAFVGLFVINLAYYLSCLRYFYFDHDVFYHKSHISVLLSFINSTAFFIVGLIPIFSSTYLMSMSFIPFIIMALLVIAVYAFSARYELRNEKTKVPNKTQTIKKVEILVAIALLGGIYFSSFFVDLVQIKTTTTYFSASIKMNCWSILTKFNSLTSSYRAVAFLLILSMTIIGITIISSIALFLSKSKLFYRVSFFSLCIEYIFMFALSIFGLYFAIVQKMSADTLSTIAQSYGYNAAYFNIDDVTFKTFTYFFFIGDTAVLFVLMFLKPFTSYNDNEEIDVNLKSSEINSSPLPVGATSGASSTVPVAAPINDNQVVAESKDSKNKDRDDENEEKEDKLKDFDACPAFSELDSHKHDYDLLLVERESNLYNSPSLNNLVNFIVTYAANSRLHLSYTAEDIATFISGLGISRLTILQGMSGTGKTSLPKIFSEAIMADCDIIEVESSWKDKNELLGYYNDFSKTFTPKKFTQAIYEASLKPEVVTFVVLDEMNLSRIEYYFSDFLSLMENEEDKRQIKLLNVKLYNTYGGARHSYMSLVNDHTLKIPTNIYFIGTANRDESTFEISDKVYDRANTMNFDKRAKPIKDFKEPLSPQFLPYKELRRLLDEAKNNYSYSLDNDERIKRVEELLSPYNISFGNRVYNQIENFVKIYCSCFAEGKSVENVALEKILFSKVVHKLEFKTIDDKDYLVHEFEKLGFYLCSEFISKLNGDF